MDRLRVVGALGGRSWRVYAGPAAFLLVATIVVALLRSELQGSSHAAPTLTPPAHHVRPVHRHAQRKLYVVRSGDTIAAISVKVHVAQSRILALNPKVSPTALFIGEKLRLR
jgi:hypothetical protein